MDDCQEVEGEPAGLPIIRRAPAGCRHLGLITIGTFFKCPDCGITGFTCRQGTRTTMTSMGSRAVRRKR